MAGRCRSAQDRGRPAACLVNGVRDGLANPLSLGRVAVADRIAGVKGGPGVEGQLAKPEVVSGHGGDALGALERVEGGRVKATSAEVDLTFLSSLELSVGVVEDR